MMMVFGNSELQKRSDSLYRHLARPGSARWVLKAQSKELKPETIKSLFMKKIITFLLITLFVLSGFLLRAQIYSLEDCLKVALDNNENLKNSQLDVQSAAYRIKETKSALLPTVNITGQSLFYQDVPAQYARASSFGGAEGTYNKLTLGMEQNTSATLQVNQQLYNHTLTMGLKAAKVSAKVSSIQEEITRENLVYNVTATYYSIQILNDNLQRLSENLSNLEKSSEINKSLRDNEIVSANSHNRILINLENLRNQYENQKLALDKNILTLKYLMNLGDETAFEVEAFDYHKLPGDPVLGDLSSRSDIRLQQAGLELSRLDKKSVIAGYYPVLSNSFNLGYNGYNDSFSPFKAVNDDWIKSSYVALTVRIPVFDGFQKQNQIRQKEITIQKNVNTLTMMQRNAARELEEAKRNYITNKNLLANNTKSLDLAEQLFKTASSEYMTGITSLNELLDAQNDLTNALTNYSTALLNVRHAELALKKADGTLLTNI
jgi:outer membrane protein